MTTPHSWEYRGVRLDFPLPPYDCQRALAERAADCFLDGRDGLLESPTGTGKTLALLSAALGWMRRARTSGEGSSSAPASGAHVVYSSRTHGQLSQAMAQLRASVSATESSMSGVTAVAMGSRDALCLNPKVRERSTQAEKNRMCKFLVKSGKCDFYNNYSNGSGAAAGPDGIVDIEDLVKTSSKRKICPYYQSRDLAPKADVVFLPYNYLFDGRIRGSLPLPLRGACAVVDEAHNAAQVCEDVCSLGFTPQDVALAISDADTIIKLIQKRDEGSSDSSALAEAALPEELTLADAAELKEFAVKFEARVLTMKERVSYTGQELADAVMDCAGGLRRNLAVIWGVLDQVLEAARALEGLGARHVGKGLSTLGEILGLIQSIDRAVLRDHYTLLHSSSSSSSDGASEFGYSKGTRFSLWCFTPGVAWRTLKATGLRAVVLASGTLHPLSQFPADFCADFPVQFVGEHVIDGPKQVLVRVVPKGYGGESLTSSYANRDNQSYVESLGQSIVEICKHVPNGAIVFFSSYWMLEKCLASWKRTRVWDDLSRVKETFVEPRERGLLPSLLREYSRSASSSSGGAVLLAVCRGKVSEGLDFTDKMARAVFMTGLPFPNVRDERVKLKMLHEDKKSKSGSEWYKLQAYRAVNQAVGRVIRNKSDFGAVFFMDRRFQDVAVVSNLSKWLRDEVAQSADIQEAIRDTRKFFGGQQASSAGCSSFGSKQNTAIARQAKRPVDESQQQSSSGSSNKPAKKKLIVCSRTNNVLKYKASNIVSDLKKSLDKEQMREFKRVMTSYKETQNIGDLLEVIQKLCGLGRLTGEQIGRLEEFVDEKDRKQFFLFASRL